MPACLPAMMRLQSWSAEERWILSDSRVSKCKNHKTVLVICLLCCFSTFKACGVFPNLTFDVSVHAQCKVKYFGFPIYCKALFISVLWKHLVQTSVIQTFGIDSPVWRLAIMDNWLLCAQADWKDGLMTEGTAWTLVDRSNFSNGLKAIDNCNQADGSNYGY